MRKNCEGEETNFGVLALLWLRLWKMFHRSIKVLANILVQNVYILVFISKCITRNPLSCSDSHFRACVRETFSRIFLSPADML